MGSLRTRLALGFFAVALAAVALAGAAVGPGLEERLRQLRERPAVSAAAQARAQQARLTPAERARRDKAALATFGVSAVTALGGVLVGVVRRLGRG